MRLAFSFLATAIICGAHPARAASSHTLFKTNRETFSLADSKTKKPPQLSVLNQTPIEISFAALAGKALGFPTDSKGLTLRFEKLSFVPKSTAKNSTAVPERLSLTATISGRDFELEPTISRADFVAGKLVIVKFPLETTDASVATLTSSGELQMRYDSAADELEIPHGEGSVAYESQLGPSGKRHLTFSAKGQRAK